MSGDVPAPVFDLENLPQEVRDNIKDRDALIRLLGEQGFIKEDKGELIWMIYNRKDLRKKMFELGLSKPTQDLIYAIWFRNPWF